MVLSLTPFLKEREMQLGFFFELCLYSWKVDLIFSLIKKSANKIFLHSVYWSFGGLNHYLCKKVIAAFCAASSAFCAIHVATAIHIARFLSLECDGADDQRPNGNDEDEKRHAKQNSSHNNEEGILVTFASWLFAAKLVSFLQVTPWEWCSVREKNEMTDYSYSV